MAVSTLALQAIHLEISTSPRPNRRQHPFDDRQMSMTIKRSLSKSFRGTMHGRLSDSSYGERGLADKAKQDTPVVSSAAPFELADEILR